MSEPSSPSVTSPTGAPKLPPRTYRKSVSTESKCRQQPQIIDDFEYSSEKLISERVLPQMVTVTLGYDGASPEKSVSVGEEFVVCFAKSTKVLPAKLEGGTEVIHIPTDSMLSVGVVRKDNTKIYHTVKDLLKLSDLPRVVEVNRAFTVNHYHVDKGTILYIRGQNGKSALFCQHESSSGQELTLTPDVTGNFSTDPAGATIFIADYTTLYNVYPITVMLLQKGVDVDDNFLQYIGQNFVLEEPIVKLSLIATTDVNGSRVDNPAVVEIPMDVPLYFKCIERPELNMEEVYSKATNLCDEFHPNKIDVLYGACVVSENDYAEVYHMIGDNNEEDYYVSFDIICPKPRTDAVKLALERKRSKNQVKEPAKKTPSVQRSKKQGAHLKKSDKENSNIYTECTPNHNTAADEDLACELATEKGQVEQLTKDNSQLTSKMKLVSANNDQLTNEVGTLKMQLHCSNQTCADLEAELARVSKNVTKLTTQLEQLTDTRQQDSSDNIPSEENQERLKKMTAADIIKLLKHMGYQQYEKSFTDECVDGLLLSTLEEEHLKDLGITSSIHCRRFLNIIQGKESVDKYLNM